MAAVFLSGTFKRTLWCPTATGHRGVNDCPSAIAGELLKAGFQTGTARPTVTKHGTRVFATFQKFPAKSSTNMFWFVTFIGSCWRRVQGSLFFLL